MSFWRLYYHLVWSTKDRMPLITTEIEPQLFDYLLRKSSERGAYIYALNGWTDHIHIVAAIPPELAISNYVKLLKGSSSHYVNQSRLLAHTFAWQRGYGALSIGEKQKPAAIDYVNDQKQHHLKQTVIGWLERASEINEGPQHPDIQPGQSPKSVCETRLEYIIEPDIPF